MSAALAGTALTGVGRGEELVGTAAGVWTDPARGVCLIWARIWAAATAPGGPAERGDCKVGSRRPGGVEVTLGPGSCIEFVCLSTEAASFMLAVSDELVVVWAAFSASGEGDAGVDLERLGAAAVGSGVATGWLTLEGCVTCLTTPTKDISKLKSEDLA